MIPKIIHYCWFGGNPLPKESQKYIESWKRFFPGWEIKQWDERNFDVRAIPYTAEAYDAKKYAFVSDYARFKILYENGGLYFDTDVEVIKDMDDIIVSGAFMGCEKDAPELSVNPGVGIGAEAGHPFYKKMLEEYQSLQFSLNENIVTITTAQLMRQGLKNINGVQICAGLKIYPVEYFCPIDYNTRKLAITPNTRTIHHYAESWLPLRTRLINAIGRHIGPRFIGLCVALKQKIK